MLVSYKWLQDFFSEPLPSAEDVANTLTFGAFEIEGIEKVGDDIVIDVDVLPNRASDCLSHHGIAQEIAVLTGASLKQKGWNPVPQLIPQTDELNVDIASEERCPIYTSALIRGVKVGPSPDWLKNRLEAIGQKSINNIVDATNYVLFELGQPLHAFDAKKLYENNSVSIGVRPAKEGENIAVLGGDEHSLTKEMTVITDGGADVPIAIAGIKGGVVAEVDDETTEIVLEAAKFDPVITRKTSQSLSLRTDASKRFENEVPDDLPFYGLFRVTEVILEIAGGELVGYSGTEPKERSSYKLGLSTNETNKILGTKLSEKDILNVLEKLGFEYTEVEKPLETILSLAPTLEGKLYKLGASVSKEAPELFDCSSFIAWIFTQVGISLPRVSVDQFVWSDPINKSDLKPGDLIFSNSGNGKIWNETHEFLPGTTVPEGVDHVGLYLGNGNIIHATRNPGKVVIEELERSESFKNIVGYRRVNNIEEARLVVSVPFGRLDLRQPIDLIEEIGRVYGYENLKGEKMPTGNEVPMHSNEHIATEKVRTALTEAGYTEIFTYSLTDTGDIGLVNALASDKGYLRSNLSSAMEEKLDLNEKNAPLLGLYDGVKIFEIGQVFTEEGEETHICIGVRGKGKKNEGSINEVLETLGVSAKSKDGIVEFTLSDVNTVSLKKDLFQIKRDVAYVSASQYPFVLRDIAVWVPAKTEPEKLIDVVKKHSGRLLVRSDMFDEYKKDERVSYAFHLVFQSPERTLTDEEVNGAMEKIEAEIKENGWEVR